MIPLEDTDIQLMLQYVIDRKHSAIDGHLDNLLAELRR